MVFALTVAVMFSQNQGEFGPEVLIGWPNRLIMVANSGWLMVVAWLAAQLSRKRS